MREEIQEHPREPERDVQQRRTTDRGTDRGTSEPGVPPRNDELDAGDVERAAGESMEGAPTEDSPAREPTERVERMEEAASDEEAVEREQP